MDENTLAYLVVIVIFILFSVIRNTRQSSGGSGRGGKNARIVYSREPDLERTRGLFGMAEQKLEKAGLTDLMLQDFHFRTQLSPAQCKDLQQAQAQLQSMLMEMLPHLHLLPDIRVIMTRDPSELIHGALGQYEHSGSTKTIRILLVPDATPALLAATLCHECSHYFLYSYILSERDSDMNEGLTEVMACLVGFSEIMIQSNPNRDLPYLNRPEFEEVRRCLLAARPALQQKYDQKQNLLNARTQLKKNLAGGRAMLEQTRAMIAVSRSPKKKLSRGELARLQQTLLALENGSCAERLNQAEKALSGDLAAVRGADDSVLAVCAELYRVMLAFQS